MIVLGSDHAGYPLKEEIKVYLEENGIEYCDVGCYSPERYDYAKAAQKACEKVVSGEAKKAILCCGTGIGISMAANKVKGIRAAAVSDYFSAKFTRMHNDANCLCLGARVIGVGLALELVDVFLETGFEGGRHQTRVDQITAIENGEKVY
ncbi:MAG: ribose 5-phosphate isomerase B [Eubacterium sp.]|jgi:ribose 5-phosphate isomerase B|nr:ribose 5-phosphate isomerase B [Eubacterium sp.]